DLNRHVFQDRLHAAFVQKSFHEYRVLHLGHDLSRYTSPDKNPSCGHEIQRAVAGLSAEDADENRQRLIADRGLALERRSRDQRRRIGRSAQLRSQPLWFFGLVRLAQKVVNVPDPGPGKNSLTADAS